MGAKSSASGVSRQPHRPRGVEQSKAPDPEPRVPPYFMDSDGYVYAQEVQGGPTEYLGPLACL